MPKENQFLIYNGQVVTPDEIITPGYVAIENGSIAEIGRTSDIDDIEWPHKLDVQWNWILPGFIDLHLQGGFGHSFYTVEPGAVEAVAQNLPRHGVTACLATTALFDGDVTPVQRLHDAIGSLSGHGAEILGIDVEGPFLNLQQRGGFRPEHIHEADPKLFHAILEAGGDRLRKTTLAPEKAVPAGFVRTLIDRGVVAALGHTSASTELMNEAVTLGMHYATHLYNCMVPFHHREPGPIGVCLTRKELVAEIITDGKHVHPDAVRLAIACKGVEGVAATTDGAPILGQPDGTYERWGYKIDVKDGLAVRDDGVLVGSTKPFSEHLKFLVKTIGLPIEKAVCCLSSTPAKVLEAADRKGTLETGKDADIVMLDSEFRVVSTWCRGQQF